MSVDSSRLLLPMGRLVAVVGISVAIGACSQASEPQRNGRGTTADASGDSAAATGGDASKGNAKGQGKGSGAKVEQGAGSTAVGGAGSVAGDGVATAPQQVSGAFLTCAYQDEVGHVRAEVEQKQPVNVGCGLFAPATAADGKPTPIKLQGVEAVTRMVCADGVLRSVPATPSGQSDLPLLVSVQPDDISCTMQVDLTQANARVDLIAYRKSLMTIGSDHAGRDFDVLTDISNQGMVLDATGLPTLRATSQTTMSKPQFFQMNSFAVRTFGSIASFLDRVFGHASADQRAPDVVDFGIQPYALSLTALAKGQGASTVSSYVPTAKTGSIFSRLFDRMNGQGSTATATTSGSSIFSVIGGLFSGIKAPASGTQATATTTATMAAPVTPPTGLVH